MPTRSDDSASQPGEPPATCDARLAQPGAPYEASGELGLWWIATLPGMLAGAGAGLLVGAVFGERYFAPMRTGLPRRLKSILWVMVVCIAAVAIVTAACTRVGRVRSAWFTFVIGLAGGLTFAMFGLCAFVAVGTSGGPMGAPAVRGGSAIASSAWALFSDWSALEAGLASSVPNPVTRVVLLVCCGIVAAAVGGATVLLHGFATSWFLYDEATGGWYRWPAEIATLEPESRPRERWKLSEWTPIVDAADLASRSEWIVLRLHGPRNPEVVAPRGREDGADAGLPLVSLERATAKDKRSFSWRKFRKVAKRDVETESDGPAFFVSQEELDALLVRVAEGVDRSASEG